MALFRRADIPKRLVPATIALGAFTFTMTALPGTTAIQNTIPLPFFDTTPFAAPGLGNAAAGVMFGLGQAWLARRAARAKAAGEGYGAHDDRPAAFDKDQRERSSGAGFDAALIAPDAPARGLPPFGLALAPIVVVITLNYVFSAHVIPALDPSFLAEPRFGATTIDSVRGVWAIVGSLTVAGLLLVALCWRRFADLRRTLDDGANASVMPIFNSQAYQDVFMVVAAFPIAALVLVVVLATLVGAF